MDRRESSRMDQCCMTAGAMVERFPVFRSDLVGRPQSGSAAAKKGKKKTMRAPALFERRRWAKRRRRIVEKNIGHGLFDRRKPLGSYGDGKFYGRHARQFRKIAGARSASGSPERTWAADRRRMGRLVEAGLRRAGCRRRQVHRTAGHRFRKDGSRSEENLRILRQGGSHRQCRRLEIRLPQSRPRIQQTGRIRDRELPARTYRSRESDVRTGRLLGQQGRRQPVGLHPEIRRAFPAVAHQGRQCHQDQPTIDFEAIFNAAYKQGLEAYYVEIRTTNDIPPMECAEKSAEYLSAAKFVK